jgi:hypothetical protein
MVLMSASRKGLKRIGMREYRVPANNGPAIIIHKENPRKWRIRPEQVHAAFYFEEHGLLRDARKAAEAIAKGAKGFAPGLDLHQ